jgi:glycine betaine/proline transport system substrate-binding protein
VNDPADHEMSPAEFYPALAAGDVDLWANGWIPTHGEFLETETPDGTPVSDHVSMVGSQIEQGGLQGVLVDAATAEAYDLAYIDDIGDDPAIAALFDQDGNGLADLAGCNDGWGCQVLLDELIESNGWSETIEQFSLDFDELWLATLDRMRLGKPVLTYVWTPAPYLLDVELGSEVVLLSVRSPGPGQEMELGLGTAACPARPCQPGLPIADILVVANTAFLSENPPAERLLELVTISELEVSEAAQSHAGGAEIQSLVDDWIDLHRAEVNLWLDEARSASN